jgi:predicted Zn-dependent peptidase
MSFEYKRVELSKSVGYNTIIDNKFKCNAITIKLVVPLKEESSALNALAISTLTSSNAEYDSFRKLSKKLNELYGSSMYSGTSKVGDIQILSVSAKFIDDRFAYDGDNITDEVVRVLLGCLLRPNVQDGHFDEDSFYISKKEILDCIDGEINNKRSYVLGKARKIIYKGEPVSISAYGTKDATLKATSTEAFETYKNLLKTANIEIFYVGSSEKSNLEKTFKDALSTVERDPQTKPIVQPSIIKEQVAEVVEELDVNQSKMVIALKTVSNEKYSNVVMNTMLGGSPFSKLFANVREKLSLCYYCQSSYDYRKATFLLDSGIEYENFEKAKIAILQQVEDLKNGNFTDDELENSKKFVCNSLKSVGDTQSSYVSWYFSDVLFDTERTIESELEHYYAITREDVIESAKALKLDTIYLLKPKSVE